MKITKVESRPHWGNGIMCQCNHPDPLLCHECEESDGVCYCKCHAGFERAPSQEAQRD